MPNLLLVLARSLRYKCRVLKMPESPQKVRQLLPAEKARPIRLFQGGPQDRGDPGISIGVGIIFDRLARGFIFHGK